MRKIKKKNNIDSNKLWICGKHPVFSALEKNRRKIFEILITKNNSYELEKFLRKHKLEDLAKIVKLVDNAQISKVIGPNQIHQGIALKCSKLIVKDQFQLLEELHKIDGKRPTLLMLDQLTDPHNIGAIIRSAASFGVKKIIFCANNAPNENATIVKSAAGCIELVDLVVVSNFSNLMEKLKKLNYWCIGLDSEAKQNIKEIQDFDNIALVIGSEGQGVRQLVKKNCDILAKIDIDKEVESLNASVACSIALYELIKR